MQMMDVFVVSGTGRGHVWVSLTTNQDFIETQLGHLKPDRAPLKEVMEEQYNYREGGRQLLQQGA